MEVVKNVDRSCLSPFANLTIIRAMASANVLFILTDQQSARAMSCAGNAHLRTPNADALAAAGMRFALAYSASPVCGPSRACLATGCLPHQHGVLVNNMAPDPALPTIGELFRRAGYDTGWSGRWHLPTHGPEIRGFECLHGDDVTLGRGVEGDAPVTDAAIDFMRRRRDGPFLLGVSLCNPHDICHWIRDDPDLPESPESLPPLPANFAIDPQEPGFIAECRQRLHYGGEGNHTRNWSDIQWRGYLRAYYNLTETVDVQVGRLMKALRQAGLEKDTVVLYTSDHGEGMAGHHWVVKLMLYEEPVTVPFIVRWPGRVAPGQVDAENPVSGIDVLPTLCDCAGVDPGPVTGISLKPRMESAAQLNREFVVTELYPDPEKLQMQGRMLRTRRYKYVAFSSGGNPEMLFDLEEDPGETRNLALNTAAGEELNRHRRLLQRWCTETEDSFR